MKDNTIDTVIYFTLGSILNTEKNLTRNQIKVIDPEVTNTMAFNNNNNQYLAIESNVALRLYNFRRKKGISTVLLIPYGRRESLRILPNLPKIERLFTRVYFGYGKVKDLKDNEDTCIMEIENVLASTGLTYEILNKRSSSPITIVKGEQYKIEWTYNHLLKNRLVYSQSSHTTADGQTLMYLFANSGYRNTIVKDLINKCPVNCYSILVGTLSWELDMSEDVDATLINIKQLELYLSQKGFALNSKVINSVRPLTIEPLTKDYPVEAMNEVNIYLNKLNE